jgi:hypothetical protein
MWSNVIIIGAPGGAFQASESSGKVVIFLSTLFAVESFRILFLLLMRNSESCLLK